MSMRAHNDCNWHSHRHCIHTWDTQGAGGAKINMSESINDRSEPAIHRSTTQFPPAVVDRLVSRQVHQSFSQYASWLSQ